MYRLFVFSFVAAIACQSPNNTNVSNSTDTTGTAAASGDTTAANAGWISLFDGTTLNGWHSYGKSSPGKAWKVEDGAIHLDAAARKSYQTDGGGDLVTNDEFENFDLKLEWKIAPKGNSGIIFYINEDTTKYRESWNTGPEMQVLDNGIDTSSGHPDSKINKHRAGDLYDLIVSKEAAKPAGEWNQVEIISNNGSLVFMMNGQETLRTTMWDDNWKGMLAGSKFKSMKDFGTFKKGKIALQDHGDNVWYRNIQIKRL